MIDITERKIIAILMLVAVVLGAILGVMCQILFDAVSHPVIAAGPINARISGSEIPPYWGSVFIIILALTGFAIALTFRFVPLWVEEYYKNRTIPKEFTWILNKIKEFDKSLQEKE